jgi:2-iminoacetate synthase ThiH
MIQYRDSVGQMSERLRPRFQYGTWFDEVGFRETLRRYATEKQQAIIAARLGLVSREKIKYNEDVLDRMKNAGASTCEIAAQERHLERLRNTHTEITRNEPDGIQGENAGV